MVAFFAKYKLIILYGVSLAAVLFVMKLLEVQLVIIDHAMEIYVGAIAVIFTSLGIWLALKLAKPKVTSVIIEKEIYVTQPRDFQPNQETLDKLGLSKREMDVLVLMTQGLSNQEIADKLFVSTNTIKTHTSNLFAKLDVKRRTAAVEAARKLGLVG